tara:strand:- start:351 stop:473 length:123 start_codon:yes stop_codon:yes gene_type:complete
MKIVIFLLFQWTDLAWELNASISSDGIPEIPGAYNKLEEQ